MWNKKGKGIFVFPFLCFVSFISGSLRFFYLIDRQLHYIGYLLWIETFI